jgi:glycosyltransferase involved in cell wall biosynthesis
MKVLQINAISKIRSTGRLCAEIADGLNSTGDEGFIAYSAGVPYEKGYKIGTKTEIKMHTFFSRLFGLQAYFSKNGTKKLIKYIEDIKPDIIHLHNLHANYINLKILFDFLKKKEIATVITLHDCWFFTGKCCHYTVQGCYKWKTECGNCPRLKKDNISWFFDRTTKMHRDKKRLIGGIRELAVVGVSDWIANEAKQSFLSSAKIITRIYNWLDLEIFKPVNADDLRRRLDLINKFVILGVSSGWSDAKGLESFLELAKVIPEDMRIVLVGRLSNDVKLPDNITHIRETHDTDEMVELYSMADVFVHLSPEETFGLVTAEALACGTPAVVINSTANPELVETGCGFISETGEANEILQKIVRIQESGKKSFSENCRNHAKSNFSKEERVKDYIQVYKRLLSGKGD